MKLGRKNTGSFETCVFERSEISSDVVDLIGIEPTTLRMRTVRSPVSERNMPLNYGRKRYINHRKRKGNVRISQPKERQGELLCGLSLPFADSDKNLWCAAHAPAGRFASQVCFGDANIALSTAFAYGSADKIYQD